MDLGPHFRAKLAHFSAKLAIKAPLEAPLGALEAPLGAVGRHLGSKMLPRRPPRGSQTPPDLHFHQFSDHFGKNFGEDFNIF